MKKKNLKQYFNKGVSTPVSIIVILVVAIIIGGVVWCLKFYNPTEIGPELPLIIVSYPTTNQEITSSVLVEGQSDTFEANVRIRIKDDNGNVLADTFTMGGAYGEMKPFSIEILYNSPSVQTGVIEVFEDSAKDGAEINKITVPVIFQDYSEIL